MKKEPALEEVAKNVETWRKSKKYRGEMLPKEITDDIRELAKYHKRYQIAEVLKMSGSTINKVLNKNQDASSCKKIRKTYSAEERQALCQAWQRSAISMEKFCKANKISKSTFYQWYRCLPQEQNELASNWIPVSGKKIKTPLDNTLTIELPLPNQAVANIKLPKSEAIGFFQELYHAIATVR